jgi:hypothetical protein
VPILGLGLAAGAATIGMAGMAGLPAGAPPLPFALPATIPAAALVLLLALAAAAGGRTRAGARPAPTA